MRFRIAQGKGPDGATRWISATGQIQRDTARQFIAFTRANAVAGLPVVLDSLGGSVGAAFATGRIIRRLGLVTTVGRTIGSPEGDLVRTSQVRCASACVLAFMGGRTRKIAADSRIEVHMFSVELDTEGNRAREEVAFRDVEQAQRTMARHAVYLHEMGIHPRYLEIMTEASFRGAARRMTRAEIISTKLADVMNPTAPVTSDGTTSAGGWLISDPSASPQLLRSTRLLAQPQRSIDHELVIECNSVRDFFAVTYRQVLTQASTPIQPVRLQLARIDTGGWDFLFRSPRGVLLANRNGGEVWMRRDVPARVFEDAIRHGRLTLEVVQPVVSRARDELFDASFAGQFAELARRCAARPRQTSTGGNPRR